MNEDSARVKVELAARVKTGGIRSFLGSYHPPEGGTTNPVQNDHGAQKFVDCPRHLRVLQSWLGTDTVTTEAFVRM